MNRNCKLVFPITLFCISLFFAYCSVDYAVISSRPEASSSRTQSSNNNNNMTDTTCCAPTSLRILSFNMAGDAPSAEAPEGWDKDTAVRDLISAESPDVVALQECPGGRADAERARTLVGESHVLLGTKFSHADSIALLVRKDVVVSIEPMHTDPSVPVVAAVLELGNDGRRVAVASVHLAPFKGNASRRRQQVESIVAESQARNVPLIVVGDTNMRPSEDEGMEGGPLSESSGGGLGLVDLWKLCGNDPRTEHSWDTTDRTGNAVANLMRNVTGGGGKNDNNGDGRWFNRFYGSDTRQYTARYDRLYVSETKGSRVKRNGSEFRLIANEPVGNSRYHFLSDHFGISATVSLEWTTTTKDTNS